MKIISLLQNEGPSFYGFVENGPMYLEFYFSKDKRVRFGTSYPKADYSDYSHFQNVMLKFNPEIPFLLQPIQIKEISLEELLRAMVIIDSL